MFAIIAFIPIIVTIIVMAGFNWPAKIALPLAWLITAVASSDGRWTSLQLQRTLYPDSLHPLIQSSLF